jgi:glycosyltransferase involved in cell wall biosynthesis
MRLLLIVDSYPPEALNAAGRMMRELAECFIDLGHEVLLATPSPSTEEKFVLVQEGKLSVLRARSGQAKGQSHLARGLAELGFPATLWRALSRADFLRRPIDGIIWYSPSIFFGPLVAWLKWRHRTKTYLILRDIFPNWALETGAVKPGIIATSLQLISELQYAVADTIGIQASDDAAYLRQLPADKIKVLPNWVRAPSDPASLPDWMREPWFAEREIIVMGGALGPAQDPENILRLAERLRSKQKCVILCVGDGDRSAFCEEARKRGLENILVKPGLEGPAFDYLLTKARLGLISLHRDLRTQNVPGRLLSHLNAGLPTVASINRNSQLFELFAEEKCGLAVESGDDSSFYQAVVQILDQPEERENLAQNAQRLAQRFRPEAAARSIIGRFAPDTDNVLSPY